MENQAIRLYTVCESWYEEKPREREAVSEETYSMYLYEQVDEKRILLCYFSENEVVLPRYALSW